jgi:anthranilate phosphoribosyltransferase
MITKAIFKVVERMNLSEAEMIEAFEEIMDGKATPAQIASLITALSMKGETVDEIAGAARSMRQKATSIPLHAKAEVLDTCGTGGDNRNTFNISTAVAFVASAAGVRVAKHGNRSISSHCGSADVMEQLGITVSLKPEEIASQSPWGHEACTGSAQGNRHKNYFQHARTVNQPCGRLPADSWRL